MWPAKRGLGAEISYGTNGPHLYLSQYDEAKPWQFARCRNQGFDFQVVQDSLIELQHPIKQELAREQSIHVHGNSNLVSDVPVDLLEQFEWEQTLLDNELIYDPTVADIVQIAKIKRHGSSSDDDELCELLFCSGGAMGTKLIVRHVERQTGVLKYDENQKPNEEKDQTVSIPCPVQQKSCEMELDSKIHQIEVFRNSTHAVYQLQFQHILVRTVRSLYLIQVIVQKDSSIRLKTTNHLVCDDFHEFEFSHACVDPYQLNRCAVIDCKGNWLVLKMSRKDRTFTRLQKGVMLDLDDMSKFKRIKWLGNADEILLVSRIAVKKVNLETETVTELVAGNFWSNMRDYTSFDSDDNYGLLLTSRELILVSVREGFKRVLAWRHFLSPFDPSMRFVTKSVKDINYVLVYSAIDPVVFVFQFKFINDLPVLLHDPVMVRTSGDESALGYQIAFNAKVQGSEDEDDFADEDEEYIYDETSMTIFKLTKDLSLTQEILSHKPCCLKLASELPAESSPEDKDNSDQPMYNAPFRKDVYAFKKFPPFKRLAKAMSYYPTPLADSDEQLAQYTQQFRIGKDERPFNLSGRAKAINVFKFEEYGEIVEQLVDHCRSIGLDLTSYIQLMVRMLLPITPENVDKITDIPTLAQFVQDFYFDEADIHRDIVTRDLALSAHTVLDPERERKEMIDARNAVKSDKLQSILADWDEDYEEYVLQDEEYDGLKPKVRHHSRFDSQADNWSQPVIRLTQSQAPAPTPVSSQNAAKQKLSQGLHGSKKRDFASTQASQSQDSQSQTNGQAAASEASQIGFSASASASASFAESQKSKKKKKKRKGGFA
ncbi:hypothetical protein WICPIJ_004947 [Wickerhamomyces pijperi]|uniref:RRN6 beta-propeller domain-containing protein n=1 Tax=Wickerhamomyces pijperi TaxID=599730 RepID=A0A9P8Q4Z4_WICPI|nr:hypothetical protein WICPIJ_004947 [Wickerhamomyces pijperi]